VVGKSDHILIVLEIRGRGRRPPSPFKFNVDWVKDRYFKYLIHNSWTPYNPTIHGHAVVHFVDNLKWIKQATIPWAHAKRVRENIELKDIDDQIQAMQEGVGWGFNSLDVKRF
jgi:hypothetical protein